MNGEGSAAPSIDTGSEKLRQTLTDLLNSHVYLAGIAVEQAVLTEDPKSQQFKSAARTLDENSQDLAAAIESIYGPEAGDAFLKQWREHIGFFVDYTIGGISKDKRMQQKAADDLAAYESDFGAFLSEATGGELLADGAAEALGMHVESLVAAVDSVLAGDPSAFDQLYEAAHGHMPMTAAALAGAIATQMPEDFDGDPTSPASDFAGGSDRPPQQSRVLGGNRGRTGRSDRGPEVAAVQGRRPVLSMRTRRISLRRSSRSTDPRRATPFLKQWREHIGFFVDYTVGGLTNDKQMQQKAGGDLAAYEEDFGAFLSEATDGELEAVPRPRP